MTEMIEPVEVSRDGCIITAIFRREDSRFDDDDYLIAGTFTYEADADGATMTFKPRP